MTSLLKCGKCRKQLQPDKFICCVECNRCYHYGKACAGISESKGAAKQDSWRCRPCQSDSHSTTEEEPSSNTDAITALSSKLEALLPLNAAITSLAAKVDMLLTLKDSVNSLHESVEGFKSSMTFLSEKYDELIASTNKHETAIDELHGETETLKLTVQEQSQEIFQLRSELNELEQYSRLANLEIHGLPVEQNEELIPVLQKLAEKLEIDFDSNDVVAAHRIPSRRNATPPVLIKFSSSIVKERWMNCRGKLRTSGERGKQPQLYFNENLTAFNKNLFWSARVKGKENRFKFVWVKNGKIFAKKTEEAPLLRIKGYADLDLIT